MVKLGLDSFKIKVIDSVFVHYRNVSWSDIPEDLVAMENVGIRISDCLLASGNSQFIRNVAIPAAQEIETIAQLYPTMPEDEGETPRGIGRPSADVHVIAGMVGVICFIGSWAATKLLDELYAFKIGPALERALKGFFRSGSRSRKCAMSLLIKNSHEDTAILIVATAHSAGYLTSANENIIRALSVARENLLNSESQSGVHIYIIEAGLCNLAPIICESLTVALQRIPTELQSRNLDDVHS